MYDTYLLTFANTIGIITISKYMVHDKKQQLNLGEVHAKLKLWQQV